MKKLIYCAVMLCMLMMVNFMYAEAVSLPADLTRIEEEAFFNCDYIRGKVYLPASVEYVGPRAFDGTRVTALQISGEATEIAPDAFGELSYIRVIWGSQIQLPAELIAKAKYLIVEPGTQTNADAAQEQINGDYLVVDDYFYYEATYDESGKGTLRLLCAIDGTLLPETVTIPARVEGMTVTEIAENAFWGVEGVTTVLVPEDAVIAEGTEDNLPAGALQTYTPAPLDTPSFSSIYSNANTVQMYCYRGWYSDAEGFYVWRCDTQDGEYEKIATLTLEEGSSSLNWVDEPLPLESTWYYALQSFRDDGAVCSEISEPQEVQVSDTMLKRPTVRATHYGDNCVVTWSREDDHVITRTDIYRSTAYDGEYTLIASVAGDVSTYTDASPEVFGKGSVYYRVQQFAVINGTEYASQLDVYSGWSAGQDVFYDEMDFMCYEEGVFISFSTYDTTHVKVYWSETGAGPWQVIDEFDVTPDEDLDFVYAYVEHLLPYDKLPGSGYVSACKFEQDGKANGTTPAEFIPALDDIEITITPDAEACETGAVINWKVDIPVKLHNDQYQGAYNNLSYEICLDNEYVGGLGKAEDASTSYIPTQDGAYRLEIYLDRMDNGESTTLLASSEVVASTKMGSTHPYYYTYEGYEYWYDGEEGSGYQVVTFSDATAFASSDQVVIYDEWGHDLYTYTGKQLAGQTLSILGKGVGVRIECEKSGNEERGFGFAIVDMVSKPYQPIEVTNVSLNRENAQIADELTWTINIEGEFPPYQVEWEVFKDDALYDSVSQEYEDTSFSLSYYPMEPGVYSVTATISDYREGVKVSGDSCVVTTKCSESSGFTYTVSGSGITITGYTGNETSVVIPSEIDSLPVVQIAQNAFRDSTVQAWKIPDTVEYIGSYAFYGAEAEAIQLSQHINLRLGNACLAYTKNLRRINLAGGLNTLPEQCFYASGLQSIHIPANIKTISAHAFEACTSLNKLTFATEGVKYIEKEAFRNCEALTTVILPKSLQRIELDAFYTYLRQTPLAVWIGSNVNHIHYNTAQSSATNCSLAFEWIETWKPGDWPFGNSIVYAHPDSLAVEMAKNASWSSSCQVTYGGPGCDELFGGEHAYEPISDTLLLDTETGLHMHDVVYQCYRCGVEKEESQAKTALGCWRCEAKAAHGADADIPADKFEFLDRYRLGGKIYYRVQLLEAYKGVKKGAGALFMDETLKMVTDDETIKYLFRVWLYTGDGTLPWEYTTTTDDYPSLERRKEHLQSFVNSASNTLSLAQEFIKMDECNKKIGSVAYETLKGLWANPTNAIKAIAEAVTPNLDDIDMDTLLVVTEVYTLQYLAELLDDAAAAYESSLTDIVDAQGIVICEEAEESLVAFADAMGVYRMCIDNGSPIIEEIANCGSAFGVGVRNIITMLKGAASDSFIGSLGMFVTDTLFKAFTCEDFDNAPDAMYGVKLIEEMCGLLKEAMDENKSLSKWVDLYKMTNFSLSKVLYMDSAFETYEKWYNAFCLKGTELQETHLTLAGE